MRRAISLDVAAFAAVLLAASAWSCGAQSPIACTSCPSIAGDYIETTQSNYVVCSNSHNLSYGGGTGPASLSQQESKLTLDSGFSISGVLHSDNSASFGPINAQAEPVDGDGNPDPSGTPDPGKLYLEGWFTTGASGLVQFDGTYLFVSNDDGCEIDSRATWRR